MLAREHRLSIHDQLVPLFEAAPSATKPDLVAAAVLVTGAGPERTSLLRACERDEVLREIPSLVDGLNPFFL